MWNKYFHTPQKDAKKCSLKNVIQNQGAITKNKNIYIWYYQN